MLAESPNSFWFFDIGLDSNLHLVVLWFLTVHFCGNIFCGYINGKDNPQ
jgi:hypothetical protein